MKERQHAVHYRMASWVPLTSCCSSTRHARLIVKRRGEDANMAAVRCSHCKATLTLQRRADDVAITHGEAFASKCRERKDDGSSIETPEDAPHEEALTRATRLIERQAVRSSPRRSPIPTGFCDAANRRCHSAWRISPRRALDATTTLDARWSAWVAIVRRRHHADRHAPRDRHHKVAVRAAHLAG